jgi:hypothetical protein
MYISDLHDEDLEIAIKVKTKVQLLTYNLLTLEGANRKIRGFLENLFVLRRILKGKVYLS